MQKWFIFDANMIVPNSYSGTSWDNVKPRDHGYTQFVHTDCIIIHVSIRLHWDVQF